MTMSGLSPPSSSSVLPPCSLALYARYVTTNSRAGKGPSLLSTPRTSNTSFSRSCLYGVPPLSPPSQQPQTPSDLLSYTVSIGGLTGPRPSRHPPHVLYTSIFAPTPFPRPSGTWPPGCGRPRHRTLHPQCFTQFTASSSPRFPSYAASRRPLRSRSPTRADQEGSLT